MGSRRVGLEEENEIRNLRLRTPQILRKKDKVLRIGEKDEVYTFTCAYRIQFAGWFR